MQYGEGQRGEKRSKAERPVKREGQISRGDKMAAGFQKMVTRREDFGTQCHRGVGRALRQSSEDRRGSLEGLEQQSGALFTRCPSSRRRSWLCAPGRTKMAEEQS